MALVGQARPRVAIDARKIGETGIGRYVECLLGGLAGAAAAGTFRWDVYAPQERWSLLRRVPAGAALRDVRSGVYSPLQHVELWGRLRGRAPRVLHATHFTAPLVLPEGTRLLVTIHDVAFLQRPDLVAAERSQRWRLQAYRLMLNLSAWRADLVCAVTAAAATDLEKFVAPARGKLRVLYPGFAPERSNAAPGADHDEVGDKRDERDLVLFTGTVTARKGVHVLVQAFARSRARERLRLVVAGPDGSAYAEEMRALAASLGIAGRVSFPGAVSEARRRELLGRARLVVLPSLLEGFGLPVLEGMLAGVPCVATRLPCVEEVAGDAALLVPSEDAAALGEAIDLVCEDEALARELVERGRRRAAAFSIGRMGEGAIALYRELAG